MRWNRNVGGSELLSSDQNFLGLVHFAVGLFGHHSCQKNLGCVMVQAVNRRLLTAEARIQTQASPCSICGGQGGTGTEFSPSRLLFLVVKGPAADATDAPQLWGLLCNPVMKMTMMMIIIFCPFPSNGAPVEWNWQGKTEVLGEKPVPAPLYPPQIPHGLTRDRTRAFAVGGRRLNAWAMARPSVLPFSPFSTTFFICHRRYVILKMDGIVK
jgi:hypothetical protein